MYQPLMTKKEKNRIEMLGYQDALVPLVARMEVQEQSNTLGHQNITDSPTQFCSSL